jgi:cyclophilin family peptidyl-prolyl cis-trans isomerase
VRVARAAIGAVSRGADGDDGQAIFLDALSSDDPRIRASAIGAIARRGSAADLAVLMDAYEAAQRDTADDAAIAAVNALGTLGRNGSPVANAFFARFDPHPEPAVRRAVAERIGDQWGETPAGGTVRGLAFYEDVVRTLVVPVLAGEPAPLLRITTPDGRIDIELTPVEAPLTVHNIIRLVESGYYEANGDPDARRWHRVVPNFVLQDGEPNGDGSGSPGWSIRDEINRLRYDSGVLGMALSGPDTGSGQWFITHSPQPHLDGGYTIFGRVVNGMDTADAVVQDDRILDMEIVRR